MGSTPGPRGLEKLYVDTISQNVRGFNHTTQTAATIKLRNERGMIRTSAHPKAEKTEKPVMHTLLLLVLRWLLFDLGGFST